MSTFASSCKLGQWYNFSRLCKHIVADISTVNNTTSGINKLIFKVYETCVRTLFAHNGTPHHTSPTL